MTLLSFLEDHNVDFTGKEFHFIALNDKEFSAQYVAQDFQRFCVQGMKMDSRRMLMNGMLGTELNKQTVVNMTGMYLEYFTSQRA